MMFDYATETAAAGELPPGDDSSGLDRLTPEGSSSSGDDLGEKEEQGLALGHNLLSSDDDDDDDGGSDDGDGFYELRERVPREIGGRRRNGLAYTAEEERAVVKKLDRRLVLFVAFLYMLSFLDRSSLSHFFSSSLFPTCSCLSCSFLSPGIPFLSS